MKKLLYIISMIALVSCGQQSDNSSESETKSLFHTVKLKGGDDKEYTIKVMVASEIKDVVDENLMNKICSDANSWALRRMTNKRTYRPNENSTIMILGDDNNNDTLTVSFYCISSNAYGVEGDVSCYYYFSPDGKFLDGFEVEN